MSALPAREKGQITSDFERVLERYLLPALLILVALRINWLVAPFLSLLPPFLTFLAAIMVTAWFAGFSAAVGATAVSCVVIGFYFIPPLYDFDLNGADWSVLGFFAVEAILMAYCIDRLQRNHRSILTSKRQLQRLQELSGRLVEEATFDSMVEEVLKASIELLAAEKGVIQLYDGREDVLRLVKQLGFTDEVATQFDRIPVGSHCYGTAFKRKTRVFIENVLLDSEFSQRAPLFQELGLVAAQSTPLFNADGIVFGVLSTYWSKPYRPSATDLNLLDLYAHQAERILLYKRNEERLLEKNEELERNVTGKQLQLMERDVKMANLMSELLLTEERERRELSSELHDSLAQLLTLTKMKVQFVERSLPIGAETVKPSIQEIEQALTRSLQYTRTLMAEFNPPDFDKLGLPAALMWLKERMHQHDLLVTLHLESESRTLPRNYIVLLYKSVRELLMNVVKHAKVPVATVWMRVTGDEMVQVTVKDQGPGFTFLPEKLQAPGHHFGLRSIEERVEKMGGRFTIVTEAGQGCTVTLELPLEENRESQQWLAAGAARPDRVGRNANYHPDQNTLPLF